MIKNNLKQKKIYFFSPSSYPFFQPKSTAAHGGAELQMYLLAKSLALTNKYRVHFFVGNYGQKKKQNYQGILLVRTIKLLEKESVLLKIVKAVIYFSQLIKHQPDMIICSNANALVGINVLFAKIFRKKSIYRTSHLIDVNDEFIRSNGLSGKIYKYGLLNANTVITQNRQHRLLLERNHAIEAFVLKNALLVDEQSLPKKEFILWVGRYQPWKKPDLFLKLAHGLPDKQFVMICPYTKHYKKNWLALKEKCKQVTNLELIEKVPFFKIQGYFNRALLFVNTSESEGFPNTFLQAALGKTPIASLKVNPDNFIDEYNCGIIADGSFEYMQSKMTEIIKNKGLRNEMGTNLFQYLKENHDLKTVGKQFETIIEKVL